MTVLAIDIGSSSVRALLFDSSARLIPSALVQYPHSMLTDSSGAAYFDVSTIQQQVDRCIDHLLQHPAAKGIQAVGLTTFVGNIVGIDGQHQALTPLLTYADARAVADFEALHPIYHATNTHQRTGCPHYTAYLPSQLHWFQRTQPTLFEQVAQWVDLSSYLYRQWFERDIPMSYSCASWSGLLNRYTLEWDTDWLAVLGLDLSRFASLADYTSVQQGLCPAYAQRWPQLNEVPFYLAVGDGAAANIGSGAVDERSIALTVGTTAALRMVTSADMPSVPAGLWGYRVDAVHHLIGGATSEGGNIYRWVKTTFQLPADAEAQIAQREPDAHGLTFVPHLAGERSPNWNPSATGSIQGLRLTTSPVDILHAALEGVASQLALIANQLPNAASATCIYAGGGALLQSKVWPQLICNKLGRELVLVDSPEVTARGCACLTLGHLYQRPFTDFMPPTGRIITPRT